MNNHNIPFEKTKLKNYYEGIDLSKYIGIIKNQIWIASKSLTKEELSKIVLKDYSFRVLGYRKISGLLIEFNEINKEQLKIIENIKTTKGIDNVYNRVYEGQNVFELIENKK